MHDWHTQAKCCLWNSKFFLSACQREAEEKHPALGNIERYFNYIPILKYSINVSSSHGLRGVTKLKIKGRKKYTFIFSKFTSKLAIILLV